MLTGAAAVVAWIGSVAWLGERRRAGLWLCGAAAVLLAAATVLVSALAATQAVPGSATPSTLEAGGGDWLKWAAAGGALLSGLVSGLAVHAMLLGHWYLNAPGMRVDALRRMIDLALAAWGLELAWSGAALATGGWPGGGVMARKTLDIPNTQSATGILYVACLAAILGELTAQLLQATV
jgi:hypothetical protein